MISGGISPPPPAIILSKRSSEETSDQLGEMDSVVVPEALAPGAPAPEALEPEEPAPGARVPTPFTPKVDWKIHSGDP